MAGGKGPHRPRRFISHLRMKRALGIPLSHKMFASRQMRARDRRRGTWWDRELNRIAIEGVDFAQDTQEGGADRFELIPDLDEEEGPKCSSLLGDDDEYVPETEPKDLVTVSRIAKPCANQGRQRLGAMFHHWRKIISEEEEEKKISKVNMENNNLQMDNFKYEKEHAKVEMESDKLEIRSKVQMDMVKFDNESVKVEVDSVKLEVASDKFDFLCRTVQMGTGKMESDKLDMSCAKVQMDTTKEEVDHIASFSDIETDDDGCWFQDGVDLRGHSWVEDDDFNEQVIDMSTTFIHVYDEVFKSSKC